MENPRLLIAEPSDDLRREMAEFLSQFAFVQACGSGSKALSIAQSFCPDILIMDLMLPELDGIGLLQRLQGKVPKVLVTSRFMSDYTAAALEKLGVAYVLPKPCSMEALGAHVQDMAAELSPAVITGADLQTISAGLLLSLGFSSKLDGFQYLQAALPIYLEDTTQSITKELYASVADLYNKEAKHVERSIRTAINLAWKNRDEEKWRELFPTVPGNPVPRPTNGSLISRLACVLAAQVPKDRAG